MIYENKENNGNFKRKINEQKDEVYQKIIKLKKIEKFGKNRNCQKNFKYGSFV